VEYHVANVMVMGSSPITRFQLDAKEEKAVKKIIICPQCRCALKVLETKMNHMVKCPQCTCEFRPNDDPCVVDEQRLEAAEAHAHEAVVLKR
jgi:uncharacterized CHY-type Zn-finger protein